MILQMKLIQQVYECTEMGDFQSACNILESLIDVDPLYVEAWEAYMQISNTYEELDILCERVLQVPGINSADRKSLLDYYFFLRQKKESSETCGVKYEKITFKVVDQFACAKKDEQPALINEDTFGSIKRGLAFILNGGMIASYAVLMIIGLSLLVNKNYFGYWIMGVLLISMILVSRIKLLAGKEIDQGEHHDYSESTHVQDDPFTDEFKVFT